MSKTIQRKWPVVLVAAVLLAVAAAAPALAEQKFEEKFDKTMPLSKTGLLYLSNISGDIEILTSKDAQVKIEAVKISKADSLEKAKENAAKVTIEVTGTADRVSVETKYPKRQGGFWGGDSINVTVNYKVWVPEPAAVEIKSVSGDVQVAAIGGKARIESVSGNVGLRGAAGAEIKLVSGDLTIENIVGDAFLNAVSGDIDVTRIKGSIEADAVSGDIVLEDVSEAQTVDIKTVSGNVTYSGQLKEGARYELKTHSGDVRMTIPAGSGFDLEANTFSGDIDSEFEITVSGKISPKEIRGTVGKGGATLILKSFSGNVDLKKK
jgi:DUF4097 and DUF4098 domain-containing protein YvlB